MKNFLRFVFLFLFVFFVILVVFVKINTNPVSKETALKNFVINQGDSLDIIGKRLKSNGFIKNQYIFIAYSYYLNLNDKLQAGNFRLSPSLSMIEIIDKLSKGGSSDYWLKIIDGYRVEEISKLIPETAAFSPKEFLVLSKSSEGRLFPDSYLIPQWYTAQETLDLIAKNFDKKHNEAKKNQTVTNFSEDEIITLASILEREARQLKSKQQVAGILINRLNLGMPLQVDASVQYARDSKIPQPKDFWQPVSKSDINTISSPFNTYKNKGLPPSPICNPGFDSLYAAYHPIDSDYLYYITGNDNLMHYAKTLDEHNANIRNYL